MSLFCTVEVFIVFYWDDNLMFVCSFFLVNQTKKPRKGAILAKKINDAADR